MYKKFCDKGTDIKVARQPRKAIMVKEAQCTIGKIREFR